jgi:hypothetical protein
MATSHHGRSRDEGADRIDFMRLDMESTGLAALRAGGPVLGAVRAEQRAAFRASLRREAAEVVRARDAVSRRHDALMTAREEKCG